jgi:DNA-binding protein HU-beta
MTNASTPSRSMSDLVDEVARVTNTPAKAVKPIILATLQATKTGVAQGHRYQLAGFGSFEQRVYAARTGTNPATKQKMTIPARTGVVFKAASNWTDMLGPKKDAVLARERGG